MSIATLYWRDRLHLTGLLWHSTGSSGAPTIRVDVPDRAAAEAQVTEMCRKLLANPVIEDFRFELSEAAS